ncbi:MAG: hypothetical protein ACHQ2Y_09350, partial [Candidatus Lutacidiplasmatales archaeon]
LLPPPGPAQWVLLGAPAALAIGGALYIGLARVRPRGSSLPAPSATPLGSSEGYRTPPATRGVRLSGGSR